MSRRVKRSSSLTDTAIALLRVSTDADRQALGAEAQREAINAWAARERVTVAAWHLDEVSGGAPLDERRKLLAALADVDAHRARFLVVHRLDRLTREPLVLALVESALQRTGATIAIVDGAGSGDDPTAELIRGILASVGRFERRLIAARIKAAMEVKRSRGELVGAPPYGYRVVPGPERVGRDGAPRPVKLLEPDPEEQRAIALVRELGARPGWRGTVAGVVRELARRGVVGRSGRPLGRDTVRAILARGPAGGP